MKYNAKVIIFVLVLVVFVAGLFFVPRIIRQLRWQEIAEVARAAAGGFPMQFGITDTMPIRCVPVPPSEACTPIPYGPNHYLCSLKPPVECGNYSVIQGQAAGGNGFEVLLSDFQISESGYKPGDSIIAGGISAALLQVVAAPGGCSGCQ